MITVLGVDPGLEHAGFCRVNFGDELAAVPRHIDGLGDRAAHRIAQEIREENDAGGLTAIAIEDYVWRPVKVTRGYAVHGMAMCRLLGRIEILLEDLTTPIHWVRAQDSLRDQPMGAKATAFGIPGTNDHQRSAFYQARWLIGTLRMSGAR